MSSSNSYQLPPEFLLEPIRTIPYDLEKYLLLYVQTSNSAGITDTLNALSDYILSISGRNLSAIRSRITELTSVLSRVFIETGIPCEHIRYLLILTRELPSLTTAADLYNTVAQLQAYFEARLHTLPQLRCGNLATCRVQGYIARNYASRISLEEAAGYVHLNPSYFSSLFKQGSGISFKQFLNIYRIEMSKRLLHTTGDSILDIAIATGFEDQSYYTKTFRRLTGTSPAKFRYEKPLNL